VQLKFEEKTGSRVVEGYGLSESSPVVDLGFGATAELVEVMVDGSTTVVHVAVTSSDERPADLSISAIDPRWTSTISSGAGGESVTLRWNDGRPPDDIRLRAVGSVMVPINGEFAVFLDDLQ
jgi:acyl-CoA synthetase (AMP-forming)/AMP-acid ligase II